MNRRLGCLVAVVIAGCAATGVTLRSNHYRLFVPPGWQVIEAGGDAVLPTLIRIPADQGAPTMDVRLFPWVVEGPLGDPTAAAFARLLAAGVIGPAAGAATPEGASPCPDRNGGFVLFGQPARAVNFETAEGQRLVITAAYANGSLVGIVASAHGERPLCAEIDALRAAIGRLAGLLAPASDTSRPPTRPTLLDHPWGPRTIEIPPADPNPAP